MASSSRRTLQPAASRARPPVDVFKPKFPIDPFAAAAVRESWFLRPEALPSLACQSRRDVILIIGAPTLDELDPLLSSKLLSNSLLIIATHISLTIPHSALPTVRILRLKETLAIEREGAVRFAVVLEWAQRVARLWRKHGGYGAIELTDEDDGQEFLIPSSSFRFRASRSTPPSPRASASHLPAADPRASFASYLLPDGLRPRPQSLSSKIWIRSRVLSLPAEEAQRAFDAIINFVPRDISDKAMLKQAILVTTISTNFFERFVQPGPQDGQRILRKTRPSFGMMSSQSSTSVYLPPTPPFQSGESFATLVAPPTKAHIVHVLPGDARSFDSVSRSKLVQSIESFLLQYAYPVTLDLKASSGARTGRARPFIMASASMGERVGPASPSLYAPPDGSPYNSWPSDCSLVELVLCGSLDDEEPQAPSLQTHALPRSTPRALFTRASDIVLLAEDTPVPPTVLVSQSEPVPIVRAIRRSGTYSRESSPPSSASSSPPKTPSARSVSPGSPLAKSERYINLNGLPTPPDSEESGLETEDMRHISRRRDDVVSAIIADDGASASSKSRKMRWRFWKRSSRSSR